MIEKNLPGVSTSLKIVVAGTIASGKTTLLGALSTYTKEGEDCINVGPFSPDGVKSSSFKDSRKFRSAALNCFNITPDCQRLDCDPWPGATDPNAIPRIIGLNIVSGGISNSVSFYDFAGETFLDAFDEIMEEQEKKVGMEAGSLPDNKDIKAIKNKVGQKFKEEIEGANIVLIVVSAKDIIGFRDLWEIERNSAERIQFAYSIMKDTAVELTRNKEDVEVLFVITQCDLYKAYITHNMKEFKDAFNLLIEGEPLTPIQIIYTSSVYQTELKKIGTEAGESMNLKFCPISIKHRREDQPCSLGIDALVRHICNMSEKVWEIFFKKLLEELKRLQEELPLLNKEQDKIVNTAKKAIEDAERLIEKMKSKKDNENHSDSFSGLCNERYNLASAISDFENKTKNCGNIIEDFNAVENAIANGREARDANERLNAIKKAQEGLDKVEQAMESLNETISSVKKSIEKIVRDLRRQIENGQRLYNKA